MSDSGGVEVNLIIMGVVSTGWVWLGVHCIANVKTYQRLHIKTTSELCLCRNISTY